MEGEIVLGRAAVGADGDHQRLAPGAGGKQRLQLGERRRGRGEALRRPGRRAARERQRGEEERPSVHGRHFATADGTAKGRGWARRA
jgi:hypothetical protein